MNEERLAFLAELGEGCETVPADAPPSLRVPAPGLPNLLAALHREGFDMLQDHMAGDDPENGRIELQWLLVASASGEILRVVTELDREAAVLPSQSTLWPVAHWQEREVYDFFGVLYEGHSDLRRLFLEDDWQGYPLRKDYEDDFMLEPGQS